MISQVIDIARRYYKDFTIEQKLLSDNSFENKKIYHYDGLFVLDYLMTFGTVSDFTRDWYRLIEPERELNLLNFARVYPIDTAYAIVLDYPVVIRSDFVISKANPFVMDTVFKTALGYYQILPR